MDCGCSVLLVYLSVLVQADHTEGCCYLIECTLVLHHSGLRVGLKIVGFVHILKHVCLDAQKRNRCSVFVCASLCFPCDVYSKAYTHVG